MRKVTKILAKIIATIALVVIILPITLSLLLSLESVQNRVAGWAATFASSYLGTEVEVGGASFNFINKLTLNDIDIRDLEHQPMLTMRELTIDISKLNFTGGNVGFDGVAGRDAMLHLREVVQDTLNIQQIIEPILAKGKESQRVVRFDNITLHNLDFKYERFEKFNPVSGVDLGDIHFTGVDIAVSKLVVFNKITTIDIVSMSGTERSGFTVDDFRTLLTISDGALLFEGVHMTTPESDIALSKLLMKGDEWADFKDFNNLVELDIISKGSRLAASDVAYFAPELDGKRFVARGFDARCQGTIAAMKANIWGFNFGTASSLVAHGTINGLPDFQNSDFNIAVEALNSNVADIDSLMAGFDGKPIPAEAHKIVSRMGNMSVRGTMRGGLKYMDVDATLATRVGGAVYQGSLTDVADNVGVNGDVEFDNVNVGALLARKDVGRVSIRSTVDGNQSGDTFDVAAKGDVKSLNFNSYTYRNIQFDGSLVANKLTAEVLSNDENLDFEMQGVADFGADLPTYDATLRLDEANLNALYINRRDSLSTLEGSLRVNLAGRELDNMSGNITLRNINYRYNNKSVYTPSITVVGRNSQSSKFIELKSEFVDMAFSSKASFDELHSYLEQSVHKYIPMLYSDAKANKHVKDLTITDSYSTLRVDFKHFAPISDAMFKGFSVADNSLVNVMFNPYSDRFSMRLTSDYVEHNNLAATDLNVNASNDRDSLSLYATAQNVYLGVTAFSSYSLMAGARNNILELSTGFRDVHTNTSATLGMRASFDSHKTAHIRLLPSQFRRNKNNWLISSDGITASADKVQIDDFSIVNGEQRLEINGIVSKNPSDSVSLLLNNYDISLLTSVISHLGYNIQGSSNGYVNVSSVLDDPRVKANVSLDSVLLNGIPSPPLKLLAGWNPLTNRAGVFITDKVKRDTLVRGYYMPQDMSYYAHLKVDSLSATLIDPLLKSTIADTRGYANADVTVAGKGRMAKVQGVVDAYDLSTKIPFTNVRYYVPQARIDIKDNKFESRDNRVFDKDGHSALLTMGLSLNHLSNVSFNLRMTPENMLVLDTKESDNELFYGKLYASGVATITGDKSGVNMDITATSQPNSEFYMPLSSRSSVAKTDFITFAKPKEESIVSQQDKNYRRRLLEARLRKASAESDSRLNINMAIHATPDVDFQLVIDPVVGDIIKARGDGRLNIQIRPSENLFEMYGDYSITEGSYNFMLLNPIIKRFTIEPGSDIQWSGDALNPMLNIDAIYKTKTSLDPLITSASPDDNSSRAVPVECIIHLGDRLMQPDVSFSIDVPSADLEQQAVIANTLVDQESISRQFFYLMFANSFIPVTSSIGSELSSTASAANGFDLLTNQLSNWLSSSNLNWVIRYRPESELTSDEIDLGFSRGLIDNRLLIEVEGNYLADNKASTGKESSASNFMGEAYITWLIDRAGTLRLKGFTQNIDSYDENQGMQETGIGIYYQESFNDFRDLPSQIKERFSRKKKSKSNNN